MFPVGKVPVLQDIFSGLVSLPTQYLMVISTSLEILSSPSPHFFYDIKSSLRKIWWPYQAGNNLHDFILANILKSSDSLEADLFNLSRRVDFPFCWWQYWSTFCISWGGEGAAYAISVDGNLYAGAAYWTSPPPSSLCLQAPSLQPPVSLKDKTSQKRKKKNIQNKNIPKTTKKWEKKLLYHLLVKPPVSVNKFGGGLDEGSKSYFFIVIASSSFSSCMKVVRG